MLNRSIACSSHLWRAITMGLLALVVTACATAQAPNAASPQTEAVEVEQPALLLVVGQATDRDQLMTYSRALPPIYAANGGRYLAVGGPGRGVEWHVAPYTDRSIVLAVFPSAEARDGFWWGDAYREAIKLRDNAGVFTVYGLSAASATTDLSPVEKAMFVVALSGEAANVHDNSLFAALGEGAIRLTPDGGSDITPLEGDPLFTRMFLYAVPAQTREAAAIALAEAVGATGEGYALAASVSGFAPPPAAD